MPGLNALDIGPSDQFVTALSDVWSRGAAAMPIDPRLPDPARQRLLDTMKPTELWSVNRKEILLDGEEVEVGDALVAPTSGTTGRAERGRANHRCGASGSRHDLGRP